MEKLTLRITALAAACLAACASCKLPLISKDMVAAAKDESGLVAASESKAVTLTWVDDPTVVEYSLRYTKNGSVPSETNGEKLSGLRSPLTIKGLANGNLHVFSLYALYQDGVTKTVGTVRSIPLAATTLAPQASGEIGQIRVRWPSINATSEFEVQRRVGNEDEFAKLGIVNGCEYIDKDISEGQVYYYRVKPSSYSDITSEANPARPASSASSPRIMASLASGGESMDIEIAGSYAYLSCGAAGFKVISIGDPSAPVELQSVAFPAGYPSYSTARSIAVSGSWLCVAANYRLAIYTLSGGLPTFAREVAMNQPVAGLGNPAWEVKISGNYAYVACLDSGIQVVNLSTGAIAQALAYGTDASISDVELCNGYLVTTGYASGNLLRVYSINASTGALAQVGSVSLPATGANKHLAVADKTVFASVDQTFYVVSLATPSSPSIQKTMDFKPQATGMSVAGNHCLVFSDFNNLVYDYDISDPAKLFLASTYEMPARPHEAVASGAYLLVASGTAGMQVLFDPRLYARNTGWIKLGSYGMLSTKDLRISGDNCFAACQDNSVGGGRFSIADISNPAAPRERSSLPLSGIAQGVAVSGSYAYVTNASAGLHIIDISDLSAPRIAATVAIGGTPSGVAVFGDLAFVTNATSQLQIVDVSDPASAALTGETVKLLDQSSADIVIDGSMAYLPAGTYYGQLQCVKLLRRGEGATSVSMVSQSPAISGAYAYARDYIDGAMGLFVTNISDPLKPVKTGYASCPYLGAASAPNLQGNVTVSGGFAYAVAWGLGVQRFSVSNPASPSYLAVFSGAYSTDVDVSGPLCAVATGDSLAGEGIQLWSLEP